MTSFRFAFYAPDERRLHLANTLAVGARVHGDVVEAFGDAAALSKALADYDGIAVLGVTLIGSKTLCKEAASANKSFLAFDKGYVHRKRYLRVSANSWQPLAYFQRFPRSSVRWEKFEIPVKPRKPLSNKARILFAGACPTYHWFFDLVDLMEYNVGVVQSLKVHSSREVRYRPQPSWVLKYPSEVQAIPGASTSWPETSIEEELGRSHLLVTHSSSAAIGALLEGVPTMILGDGLAKPISLGATAWDQLETPLWPADEVRHQFFSDMAYCQWTYGEYSSGEAWRHIRTTLLQNVKGHG